MNRLFTQEKSMLILKRMLVLIICACALNVNAQKTEISGYVIDKRTSEPLVGATVMVKGSSTGSIADVDGRYVVPVSSTNDILVFSYIGYSTKEIQVGNRSTVNVELEEDISILSDVVVIGYGKTTKKEVTGSVTSLKSEELNKGTFTNAMGLLQGKVAGLSIVKPGGADPTASYEILLRGANTLVAGQGPLIIIDGVAGADIRDINFQEVESIDVLKDGSAAAIYGTRGSNGVIIITTKRAKSGFTQVEYDGQITTESVTRRATPLTTNEFKSVINNYRPALANNIYNGDTDWFKEITRTPISHKHNLSVSGGSDKFSHRTVLNIEENQGIQIFNDASKMLFRTNINQKALDGWLDLDYNVKVVHRSYKPSSTSAFQQAFIRNPTESVYDESNLESGGWGRISSMEYYNPVAMLHERDVQRQNDSYGGNLRATLNILSVEGLRWDNFISINRERYESRSYFSRYYPSLIGTDGEANIENYLETDTQYESTLNYSKQFKDHGIQALAGYTYQYTYGTSSSMSNSKFDTDDYGFHNIGAGEYLTSGQASMDSYKEDNTYIGFFGRFMYNFNEKYLLSASIRRDGSSRFGDNNKWGWFPAVSGGWRISQESFMEDVSWLNELKLRAGFGVTGNQDFANYKSLLMMTTAGKFFYNGKWINTYQPASNANPDLAWEKKSEFNVGLEFSLLNNRITGAVDYYQRKTSDLLYEYTVPTPPYIYNTMLTNVGQITNKGIELSINFIPIQTKKFKWSSGVTASRNKNILDSFTNEEFSDGTYKVGWAVGSAAFTQRLIEGESLGSFYGPVWLGIDENGSDILREQDENGSVPEESWEKIGNAYPDVVLGWSNLLTYKKFDLGFSFRASIGGDVLNQYAMLYENLGKIGLNNISSKWLEHTDFTSLNFRYSSKYIEDATFLKLDNITLGYTVNKNLGLVNRIRFSLTAQNLFCLTNYSGVDPEVSLSGLQPGMESTSYYPRTSVFTFGANITF